MTTRPPVSPVSGRAHRIAAWTSRVLIACLVASALPTTAWAQTEPEAHVATADLRGATDWRVATGLLTEFGAPAPASAPAPAVASDLPRRVTPDLRVPLSERTSLAWPVLQVSFGALQVLDTVSTLRGVNAGLREVNPLLAGLAHHPAAYVAVKAGAATATLWLMRDKARKNRIAAIVTMAAINSGYAFVVAQNVRQLRQR
jgi:hypothetical protein